MLNDNSCAFIFARTREIGEDEEEQMSSDQFLEINFLQKNESGFRYFSMDHQQLSDEEVEARFHNFKLHESYSQLLLEGIEHKLGHTEKILAISAVPLSFNSAQQEET
mmetsp:Transcript_11796/g.18109  ORF Transcript_11796/g.18109 Transcript_11796/m.18109 type:complete len:108 (+) Transcript_11796:1433-1756(+)